MLDDVESSKAYDDYDRDTKARALPFVVEVLHPNVCLPIGVDPKSGKVDAMLIRTQRSVRSLKALGFDWDLIGEAPRPRPTSIGASNSSSILGGGQQMMLYELMVPGGCYYQVGGRHRRRQEGRGVPDLHQGFRGQAHGRVRRPGQGVWHRGRAGRLLLRRASPGRARPGPQGHPAAVDLRQPDHGREPDHLEPGAPRLRSGLRWLVRGSKWGRCQVLDRGRAAHEGQDQQGRRDLRGGQGRARGAYRCRQGHHVVRHHVAWGCWSASARPRA